MSVQIYWLRDSGAGTWKLPISRTAETISTSAISAVIAEMAGVPSSDMQVLSWSSKLAAVLRKFEGTDVEVMLPAVPRASVSKRIQVLISASLWSWQGRRLWVQTATEKPEIARAEYECELLMMTPFSSELSDSTCEWTTTETVIAGEMGRFACGRQSPRAEVDAEWNVCMPREAAKKLLEVPIENETGFTAAWTKVSMAVQAVMRRWIPYLHLHRLEGYAEVASFYPMLAYQAARPFEAENQTQFTSDYMNPDDWDVFFRSSSRNLPGILRNMTQNLAAAGEAHLIDFYDPEISSHIIKAARRQRALLARLVRAEGQLVELLIALAMDWRAAAADPTYADRRASAANKRCLQQMAIVLRRMHPRQSFEDLAPVILMAAIGAMQEENNPVSETLVMHPRTQDLPLAA